MENKNNTANEIFNSLFLEISEGLSSNIGIGFDFILIIEWDRKRMVFNIKI